MSQQKTEEEGLDAGPRLSGPRRFLEWLERALMAVSTVSLVIIMLLMTADAAGRYLFHQPIVGAQEVIEMYLLGVIAFLPLAGLYAEKGHISMDTFLPFIRPKWLRAVRLINAVLMLVVFGVVSLKSGEAALGNFLAGRETAGLIALPIWIGWSIASLGSTVLCLRIFVSACEDAGSRP